MNAPEAVEVIELSALKERIHELVLLHTEVADARANYSDAIKATAEASGLLSTVIAKFVAARAKEERFSEKRRQAEQLSLLFDEIGLVSGS